MDEGPGSRQEDREIQADQIMSFVIPKTLRPMLHRAGFFKIDEYVFYDNPELFCEITRDVAIVRCEHLVSTREFIFEGYSFHFDETPPNIVRPEYVPIIKESNETNGIQKAFFCGFAPKVTNTHTHG